MKTENNYSLSAHNTFGIEARCRQFVEYKTVDELRDFISRRLADAASETSLPLLHIGGGSNLLFTTDFPGIVLHSAIKGVEVEMSDAARREVVVKAGAGENWDDFVAYCVEQGYYGLENLSYIPGEVGASAVQNIGAYGSEVCQYIEKVETIDLHDGSLRIFLPSELHYAYRSSAFKHELKGRYAVTSVCYRLSTVFRPNLSYAALTRALQDQGIDVETLTAASLRQAVINVRRGKLPEPSEIGSAGSFFVNPVVSSEKFCQLQQQYPGMPHYAVENGVKIPAGWMIEQCGWKGKNLGRAGVYEKQALVLVNRGGATGADIVRLSDAVRADVVEKFGVDIHPEVNFI